MDSFSAKSGKKSSRIDECRVFISACILDEEFLERRGTFLIGKKVREGKEENKEEKGKEG